MSKLPFFIATTAAVIALGLFIYVTDAPAYGGSAPETCANCHVMDSQYENWYHAPHEKFTECVDCHLPHDFIGKYVAKAENGWHHSKGFTLQDFHEPIQITPRNRAILQDNCLRCHTDFVHAILPGSKSEPTSVKCVHCHVDVGHGETTGLGGPEREHEIEAADRASAIASQGKQT